MQWILDHLAIWLPCLFTTVAVYLTCWTAEKRLGAQADRAEAAQRAIAAQLDAYDSQRDTMPDPDPCDVEPISGVRYTFHGCDQ